MSSPIKGIDFFPIVWEIVPGLWACAAHQRQLALRRRSDPSRFVAPLTPLVPLHLTPLPHDVHEGFAPILLVD